MNHEVRALEPTSLWNYFADLNAVPRASKKEGQVIQLMLDFGETLGLETFADSVGNVIIRKPATTGMEDRKMVVMQSHLDMVHQKNADTDFDFDTQGIQMSVVGDWVKAKGTTLGADNGLGVATIMAVLASEDIAHPAIEALFTIDEETGMTGVMGLEGGILQGEILLNLDTEEDDEIGIGCAGGIDITATRNYAEEEPASDTLAFKIQVKGLQGGHSGMDIDKGLGNANKIMNRLLAEGERKHAMRIAQIQGGGLRNAIPRESKAVVLVVVNQKEAFENTVSSLTTTIKAELKTTEPSLTIVVQEVEKPLKVMESKTQSKLLKAIYAAHNGVYTMSADIPGLVETSNNIANVTVKDGTIQIGCLTRSSVESGKEDLANALKAAFELAGCNVGFSGSYPGWSPNVESPILKTLVRKYEALFNEEPHVAACHAGLECGILGQNYPEMDMISFGPTIKGAHSPDERASISSVRKYWKFVQEILKDIPKK